MSERLGLTCEHDPRERNAGRRIARACVSAWRGLVGALERGLSGLCVVASKARGLGEGYDRA